MKQKNKYHKTTLLAGLILIILGIIYSLTGIGGNFISLLFINIGLILAIVSMLKFNRLGAGSEQDERTRQLSTISLSYSWLLTFIVLNVVFWLDWLNFLNLTLSQGVSLIISVMIISASIAKWWLNTKGYQDEK
jgi:hypothetical protein